MKQEDYNAVMTDFKQKTKIKENNKCPTCGFPYLGDGKKLCIDCEYNKSENEIGDKKE
ncbi:hypothetical protein VPKG_00048 [Vibrio phage pYD21-A]|uniref:hypothetical protein n=1 Tax=Vibrio phage pYD21-A TaxID=754049 RepID=UPI0002C08C9D|nr:hypothetical protein VPKG_00048 [Vibrio phage pYD21-A]AGH16085.1 hypothetical protein VPKG_00048 [Vibrio phage pYD21-A]